MRKALVILLVVGFILSSVSMVFAFNSRQEFFQHVFGKKTGDTRTLVETGQGWCVVAVQMETIDSNVLVWKGKCYNTEYWVHKAKQLEALK